MKKTILFAIVFALAFSGYCYAGPPCKPAISMTEEGVEDYAGGMVTGNTETGIAVTYQDDDGTLDFVVSAGSDTTAIHDDTTGEINAITEKATPVAADLMLIEDSEASNAKKKVQVTNLPIPSATQTALDARCLESVFGTSIGTGLLLDGTALKTSAILQEYHAVDPVAAGLTYVQLTDAGADTIAGWDDSAGAAVNYTLGTGLSTTGTTINVSFTTADLTVTDSYIIVGDASNDGQAVAMSGHAGISNAGAVTVTDFALTADADAGDLDIQSVDKLEGVDAAVYIDMGADGIVEIEADTKVAIGKHIEITDADPYILLDEATASDTDWWIMNDSDQSGDDNDPFVIGSNATPGTTPQFSLSTDGDLTLTGDTITTAAASDPYIYFNETDGTDWYVGVDDAGDSFEFRTNVTVGNSVVLEVDEDGDIRTTLSTLATGAVPAVVLQGYTQTSHSEASTVDVTGSSLTIPDGYFTEGHTLKYTAGGTVTGANGTISVILYFDDVAIMTLTTADGAAGDWYVEFIIVAVDNTNQRIIGKLFAEAGAETICDYAADTTDITSAGTLPTKLQIALAHADDTITAEYVMAEAWNKAD